MPHLIIEYSANVPSSVAPRQLLAAANAALLGSGEIVPASNLKSRAQCCADYQVGAGDTPNAFVHARLHLLAGRSVATRHALCQSVCEALAALFEAGYIEITAEAIDMVRESYAKVIVGAAP